MKRTGSNLLRAAATAALGLTLATACGGAASGSSGGKVYHIKFAISTALTDAAGQGAQEAAKRAREKSNGRLDIKIYPNEELGGEPAVVEGLKNDTIQMAFLSPGSVGSVDPDFQILNGPFLFPDWQTEKKVMEGPMGKRLADGLTKRAGIEVLDPNWYWGWRDMTANKPIRTPADIAGLKMRSPNIPIFVDMFKALGVNPTTTNFNEIYTALQQGVINGQENPVPTIYQKKFFEVNKDVSLTRHILQSNMIMVNASFFGSLPKDLQDDLLSAVKLGGEKNTQVQQQLEESLLSKMRAEGVTVVTDVDREAFRKATEKVYDDFRPQWTPNLYQDLRAAILKAHGS